MKKEDLDAILNGVAERMKPLEERLAALESVKNAEGAPAAAPIVPTAPAAAPVPAAVLTAVVHDESQISIKNMDPDTPYMLGDFRPASVKN